MTKKVARTLGDRLREAGLPATDAGRAELRRREARAPWTEAHRREALRRTYEIAGEFAESTRGVVPDGILECPRQMAQEEQTWRADLGSCLSAARIAREVRRVRALAEGRLVRETSERWEVAFPDGGREGRGDDPDHGEAYARLRASQFRLARVIRVTVTRIRRA